MSLKIKRIRALERSFAIYESAGGIITIGTKPEKTGDAAEKKETVKIGNIEGKWLEWKSAVYPNRIDGQPDLTKKPSGFVTKHAVVWDSNSIEYMLYYKDRPIPLEEAILIAESFIRGQK